jgi:hypothetical protein
MPILKQIRSQWDENDWQNFDTTRSAFILGPCAPFPSNSAIAATPLKLAPACSRAWAANVRA